MIEFLYCKRFTYYMKCLGIKQYEDTRYKVKKGKEIHDRKENENKEYLRKKLGVIKKYINVKLYSQKYKIKGKVDEVLTLKDNTMAALDYKFAEYEDRVYTTYKTQILMYSIMIAEMYNVDVKKGYLVYCRSKNFIKDIDIDKKDIKKLEKDIKEYQRVIKGYYPTATKNKSRCNDCCYRNICIK